MIVGTLYIRNSETMIEITSVSVLAAGHTMQCLNYYGIDYYWLQLARLHHATQLLRIQTCKSWVLILCV